MVFSHNLLFLKDKHKAGTQKMIKIEAETNENYCL